MISILKLIYTENPHYYVIARLSHISAFGVITQHCHKGGKEMTANQIAYQNLLETRRANLARETETARHQQAQDAEMARHNLATEGISSDTLTENIRHNKQTEQISLFNFGETQRANKAKEAISIATLTETNRANLAKEAETHRANVAAEEEKKRANQSAEAINMLRTEYEHSIANEQNKLKARDLDQQYLKAERDREMNKWSTDVKLDYGKFSDVINLLGGVGGKALAIIGG